MKRLLFALAVFAILAAPPATSARPAESGRGAAGQARIESVVARVQRMVARSLRLGAPGATENVTAETVSLPDEISPRGCCSAWKGFNLTSTLVAPTVAGVPCINCLPGAGANHLAIPFPEGRAFQGGNYSTLLTFHSTIAGACSAHFVWFSLALNRVIAGNSWNTADCGSNNVWLINFFDNIVPPAPGNAVAIGVIVASDGTTDVDYKQFLIQ
jgi:hypothetical protein